MGFFFLIDLFNLNSHFTKNINSHFIEKYKKIKINPPVLTAAPLLISELLFGQRLNVDSLIQQQSQLVEDQENEKLNKKSWFNMLSGSSNSKQKQPESKQQQLEVKLELTPNASQGKAKPTQKPLQQL